MFGSRLCCSKNIHCIASARSMRSSGASAEPPAMYQRMALDWRDSGRRDFEQRHLAVRILGEKFRRMAFALEDVDLDQPVRHAELRQASRAL